MIDIEQQAVNTFQNNFAYFASQHPTLHEKINILQSAIESGQYKENYSLEYINGYFDLKELNSGQFMYGASSDEHAQITAEKVSFKKNVSVIETFYNFPYTQANVDDLDKLTIINSWMTGTAPIVRFVNEHTSSSDEMKKIYKFVFFGVGLGTHLTEIDKKIAADSYFIIEDNLELFRLSMFVTNYQDLGKKAKLFFSIMDNPGDFKTTYNLFAEDMLIRNAYLKFYLLSDAYAHKIKQIQNFAVTKSNLLYPYNYLLHKNVLVSHAIHENYNFLNISKPFENSEFVDKPLLYLAAGPSLDHHMQWVKENQDKFIIMTVFMIMAKLEAAGIHPDIVVHVDEAEEPVEATIKKLKNREFLKESLFILAASAPLSLLEPLGKKENIFLIEDRTRYKKDHGFIEFFSVGEVGYALSLIFSIQNVYLLGLDLALDQETGKTHAQGHATLDKVDLTKGDTGPEQTATVRDTVLSVKGNKQDLVFTTPVYDTSIYQVNYFTSLYKQKNQNIYNLSNGAYFNETLALETQDVEFDSLDKTNLQDLLYKTFKNCSTDHLSVDEKNNIIIRKKEVKKKVKLIERFKKQNIKNEEEFRKQFISLIGGLITPVVLELNEVSEIFLNYFQTAGSYIGNFLNSKNSDDLEVIKELQEIISRQLYKILHDVGSFEFDYINGEKYFNTENLEVFKNKILDINIESKNLSKINEIVFSASLKYKYIDANDLLPLFEKNSIGFLALIQNLEDISFVGYIKQLSKTKTVKLKAFCLSENEEFLVKETFGDNVIVVRFKDIYQFASAIEIYLYSGCTAERFLYINLIKYSSIACLDIQERSKEMLISDFDIKNNTHEILMNSKKHIISQEEFERYKYSYTRLIYEKIYHNVIDENFYIDTNSNFYDFYMHERITYILQNVKYKEAFVKLFKKFIT